MKTLKIILLLSLITILPSFAQTWEFVGLDSMVIKHLFISGDTIWAGTAHRVGNLDKSGFYKSTDTGNTWVQLDSVLGVGTNDGIYIDKEHTINILISKGFNSYTGSGTFYKTTDGGENWQEVQCVTRNCQRTSGCISVSLLTGSSMVTRSPASSKAAKCSWRSR